MSSPISHPHSPGLWNHSLTSTSSAPAPTQSYFSPRPVITFPLFYFPIHAVPKRWVMFCKVHPNHRHHAAQQLPMAPITSWIKKQFPLFFLFFKLIYFSEFLNFFKDFIYFLREGKGGRKEEKHQCVVASHLPPTGDLAHNPGTCPDWELNRPLISQASTQST